MLSILKGLLAIESEVIAKGSGLVPACRAKHGSPPHRLARPERPSSTPTSWLSSKAEDEMTANHPSGPIR
jgi:hypothetical protein